LRAPAIAAHLHADEVIALLLELAHVVHHFLRVAPVGVRIDSRRLAAFAAQQVIDRHVGQLALDVPQRHVDARDRVVQDGPVAPGALHHGHLEELFAARDVPPDCKRLQVVFDGRCDGPKALGERCAANAI